MLGRVNFDCDIEVNGEKVRLNNVATDLMPAKDALLSWCGYYINCRTLEVNKVHVGCDINAKSALDTIATTYVKNSLSVCGN